MTIDYYNLEKQHNLPAGLLAAVQKAESGGDPNAVSPVGAQGLFQFMPKTAKAYGIDPFNPDQAAIGAARMFGDLSKQFGGDTASMLAAYNWGSGNLSKKGIENAPAETRNYVNKIIPQLGKGVQVVDASGQIGAGSEEVTDPELLKLLNSDSGGEEVTDPALLAQLEAKTPSQKTDKMDFGEKSALQSFGQGIGEGASFGLLDEAVAGILTPFMKEKGQSWGDAYSQLLQDARGSQSQAQEQSPWAYGGGMVAGAIPATIAGAGVAAKVAPAVAESLGGYIAANPVKGSGIAGALQGGVYGFGTGEGSAEERAKNALLGVGLGAAGGAVAGGVAENVIKPAASALAKLGSRFGNKVTMPKAAGAIADDIAPISELTGQPVTQIKPVSAIATEKGNIVNLPKGIKEGDVALLRAQEEARQGILGAESQALQRKIDEGVVSDIKGVTQSLIGKEAPESADDLLMRGIDSFRKQYATEKASAGKLMEVRNNALANASVYRDYTHQTLTKGIDDLMKSPENAVFYQTTAAKPVKEYQKILSNITKPAQGGKFSKPIDFTALQGWSASTSAAAREAGKSGRLAEERALNQMVGKYNDWLDNISREAIKSGDDDVVEKIFTANRNYANFKKTFGANIKEGESKIIDDILQKDALTPSQLVDMLFGRSARGKGITNQIVGKMLAAMPDGAARQSMINDFRAGLIMRAYKESLNPDDSLKLATFANKLRDLHQSPAYKAHLSSPDYDTVIKGLYQDISKYTRAINDPTIRSTSGTGGFVARTLGRVLENPAIKLATAGQSSNINTGAQWLAKGASRGKVKQVEREFFNQLDGIVNGNPKQYMATGAAGSVIANRDKKESK